MQAHLPLDELLLLARGLAQGRGGEPVDVAQGAPPAPEVRPWVEQLIQRVEADVEISAGFKDVWRRYLGV